MIFEKLSKNELYEIAKAKGIKNRSKMSREELLMALGKSIESEKILNPGVISEITENVGYQTEDGSKVGVLLEEDYPIPEKYDVDVVVFLPIDPKRAYVCWEVTYDTINKYVENLSLGNFKIALKLFVDGVNEIAKVNVSNDGNFFFHNEMLEDKEAWAEIGVEENGKYFSLLSSKRFKMPSNKISDREEMEFMTVKEHVEKVIKISIGALGDYYSSIDLHKKEFKVMSSKNNVDWR